MRRSTSIPHNPVTTAASWMYLARGSTFDRSSGTPKPPNYTYNRIENRTTWLWTATAVVQERPQHGLKWHQERTSYSVLAKGYRCSTAEARQKATGALRL